MYGTLISLGILTSLLIIEHLVKKDKEDINIFWGVSFWAIFGGLIGARIYHVVDYHQYYFQNPIEIFKIWNGGVGIYGAIFGGFLSAIIYLKIKKANINYWINTIVIGVPLAQAIGRWGNFFNQELFGIPTSLPWGLYITPEKRPEQFLNIQKFHPLFLYETLLNLILFFILLRFRKSHVTLYIYLIGYSLIRFCLEFLRINPWNVNTHNFNLNVAQTISVVVIFISSLLLIRQTQSSALN